MPIKIPDSLPARKTLEGENIFVMTEYRAIHQDIQVADVFFGHSISPLCQINRLATSVFAIILSFMPISYIILHLEDELFSLLPHHPKQQIPLLSYPRAVLH